MNSVNFLKQLKGGLRSSHPIISA